MEGFFYDDDLENDQKNIRRLASIEESINRTLLYDGEKNELSCNNACRRLTYIIAGLIIVMVMVILILILVIKHSS